jgi:hypothetical protein
VPNASIGFTYRRGGSNETPPREGLRASACSIYGNRRLQGLGSLPFATDGPLDCLDELLQVNRMPRQFAYALLCSSSQHAPDRTAARISLRSA